MAAVCPDCRKTMQAFYVPAKGRAGEVELDRCSQCGALWFNAGELEQALQKTVRRRQGTSSRSCPACREKLQPAVLDGRIDVERCGTCEGVFLDGHDVDALSAKRASSPSTAAGSGFACEGCGARRPFGEATSTLTGLICARCVARAQPVEVPAELEKRSALGRFFSWLGASER
ncbi:MAG: zf-TFIIB domain-containing protein [Myxococcus sp.]|nr:zf-TFIIB domain-containing protein [Myxococcus sp.]